MQVQYGPNALQSAAKTPEEVVLLSPSSTPPAPPALCAKLQGNVNPDLCSLFVCLRHGSTMAHSSFSRHLGALILFRVSIRAQEGRMVG